MAEMIKKINDLFVPGEIMAFAIKNEQLEYLDKYLVEIEKLQRALTEYYVGNEPTINTKEIENRDVSS
jgi:hypothetical protein